MSKEEYVLDFSEREKVLLGKRLNFEETAEVLDLLRNVKGLTFDFSKTLHIRNAKKNELESLLQGLYKKIVSENSKIRSESIARVGDFHPDNLVRSFDYIPFEVDYSFGNMSCKEIVDSRFRTGYVRIKNRTSAIVSFDGALIGQTTRYICHLNNIYDEEKFSRFGLTQSGLSDEVIKEYQSKLFKLLEGKLLKPQFIEHAD
ncbi:hypothetical protein HY449_00375 [Candidatus Pacearchaeota archaeon]|nr:hypothetical protein [Candidatus Pacearchaeota archaeon]